MRKTIATWLGMGLLATTPLVSAQSMHPVLDQKHTFRLGIHQQNADATIGYNRPPLPEVELELNDLGVDDTYSSGYFRYRWRFKPRWSLVAVAQRYKGDGTRSIEDEINWDGEVFPVGASLDTEFTVDTYMLDVLWSAYKGNRGEVAIGGGLHAFDINTTLSARAFIGEANDRGTRESSTFLAPLPNLRASGFFAITPKWSIEGTLGWLDVSIDDYTGSFTYLKGTTEYRFTERFGAGIGYQFTSADVTEETDDKKVTFDMSFDGPILYLNYSF